MGVLKKLKDGILLFDGAMGTALQSRGLKLGELPDIVNINSPEIVTDIHRGHIECGVDVVTTNAFGANEAKLKGSGFTVEQIIDAAVRNAKKAIEDRDVYVALGIGPIGELLEPMGTLSFEDAYNIAKRQVIQGAESGADLILIETMIDLYEAKAAILAAKENSDLPVFCTMSFEEDGRTFTGCNIKSMVMVLEGLGVDALGVNCSLGPKELAPIVDEILNIATIPVMVQPNAGLPSIVNGETVFNISPEDFSYYGKIFVENGVRVIGGCCGTTNEHIKYLVDTVSNIKPKPIQNKPLTGVCTPTKAVIIDRVKIIGERINPTGKKRFKEALVKSDIDYILKEAIDQVEAGAHILDVNVGLPEIDEVETMVRAIKEIQSVLDVPLQVDSTDPKVIEEGLRIYNGKAIVNSINGEDGILESILPIVKKYGASVVGLTLDEKGIPSKAEGRFKIAEKIVKKAGQYGINREDIYIDCLTLTAAAQQEEVEETLKALSMVKEKLGVKTVLGVSNVSFGLPNRDLVNRTFLAASLFAGLDLPIIDPMDKEMMDTIMASGVLWNEDKGATKYLKYSEDISDEKPVTKDEGREQEDDLFEIILNGMREKAKTATIKLLEHNEPLSIVDKYIVPALDLVGEKYEKGETFLPQLIQSAETVKNTFEIIRERLSKEGDTQISNGKIILATVKGDIHDIGKNIVKVLLENYNYEIIDLGRDVPKEKVVEAAVENDVRLIGLSALMTTTVKNMEETIEALKEIDQGYMVMVGGAVLNEDYAEMINADYYGMDAKQAVAIAKKVLG